MPFSPLPRAPERRFPQVCSQAFPQAIPHFFPQLRRPLLALGATLLLLGGCTTVQRPARPQAVPLADSERVATTPGATPRQRIVEIAMQEWRRWGGQTVRIGRDDTACVTSSPLPPPAPLPTPETSDATGNGSSGQSADTDEGDVDGASCLTFRDGTGMEATPEGCALAQRYWRIVGEAADCQRIRQPSWAWSAVFISWVMRQAGLTERQFLTGGSHAMYVVDARDGILPAPAFRVVPVPAMPRPGDLVCAPRGRDKYLDNVAGIRFGATPMHCDIVVEVDRAARVVKAIGGNVQQSVSMEVIELGDSGQLDGVTNSHLPWLLVMRNTLP